MHVILEIIKLLHTYIFCVSWRQLYIVILRQLASVICSYCSYIASVIIVILSLFGKRLAFVFMFNLRYNGTVIVIL